MPDYICSTLLHNHRNMILNPMDQNKMPISVWKYISLFPTQPGPERVSKTRDTTEIAKSPSKSAVRRPYKQSAKLRAGICALKVNPRWTRHWELLNT